MSRYDLEVLATDCIEEIGQENWDSLSAGRAFASYSWYRFGERAMAGSTPLYICVSHFGAAVARATFWLVRDEPLPLTPGPLRSALHAFLYRRPLLICRSPIASTSGLILPDTPMRKAALDTILEAAREYGRKMRASFVVFDYLSPDLAGLAEWPSSMAPAALDEPGTTLPVRWESFAAYLKGMSKSAWKDYRRQHNQADRLGLEIRVSGKVDEIEAALPLIRAVERRHNSSPNPWARAILENAASDSATWITAWVGSRLAGCGLLLADSGVLLATLLGLDHEIPYVYFQIVYQAIQQAIEQGARALRAGTGAYELKQRLGFQIEANNSLRFSGQGRFLNWAGRLVAV